MKLALSCVSSQGIWLLMNPRFKSGYLAQSWSENESSEMSQGLSANLDALLEKAGITLNQIEEIFGVTGPGAFTGLRITGSYLRGLARSLGKSVYGIPSIALNNNQTFWIPLQHQKVKTLSLKEALDLGVEFLEISPQNTFTIGQPESEERVWGLAKKPFWPSEAELFSALSSAHTESRNPFEIVYGSQPKLFGKRLS